MLKKLSFGLFILVLLVSLIGCQPPTFVTSSPTPSVTETSFPTSTSTSTSTPTPSLPVGAGTPMPFALETLTVQNIARVENVVRYASDTMVWNVYHTFTTDPEFIDTSNSFILDPSNYILLETNHGVQVFTLATPADTSTGIPLSKIADLPFTAVFCSPGQEPRVFVGAGNKFAILTDRDILIYDPSSAEFSENPQPINTLPLRMDAQRSSNVGCIDDSVQVRFTTDFETVAISYPNDFGTIVDVFNVTSGDIITTLQAWLLKAFSPDGRYLVTYMALNGQYTVQIWDVQTGLKVKTYTLNNFLADYGFSPDGTYLYIYSYGQAYTLIQLPDGALLTLAQSKYGANVRFSNDYQRIAIQEPQFFDVSAQDWQIFDVATGRKAESLPELESSQWVFPYTSETTGRFLDFPMLNELPGYKRPVIGHTLYGEFVSAGFQQDGTQIVVRSETVTEMSSNWDLIDEKQQNNNCLYAFAGEISCQTSEGLYTMSPDGRVYFAVQVAENSYEFRDEQDSIIAMLTLDVGQTLSTFMVPSGKDYLIIVLDTPSGPSLRITNLEGIPVWFGGEVWLGNEVTSSEITISSMGRFFIIKEFNSVKLLDIETMSVVFSENGMFPGPVVFTQDGNNFLYTTMRSADDQEATLRILETETRKLKQTLRVDVTNLSTMSAAFSPDGTMLALGFDNGGIAIFDLTTGDQIIDWHAHDGFIQQLQFSPDGSILLSIGGLDQEVKLWGVAP